MRIKYAQTKCGSRLTSNKIKQYQAKNWPKLGCTYIKASNQFAYEL